VTGIAYLLRIFLAAIGLQAAFALHAAAQEVEEQNYFGKRESTGGTLIGTIYDFKQTQKRESTRVGGGQDYVDIIEEFLNKNWDESVLNRFFRSSRPLYTTQIFIPLMSAAEAPKAFEVEDIMEPAAWVVHYKGQVSPPEDGAYRFIGWSDDLIVVRVNDKIVLGAGLMRMLDNVWKPEIPGHAGRAGNGHLVVGDWVVLKKDEPVDFDVLVGERPGGQFCAFLMYEKSGVTYKEEHGQKHYPIFQLAPAEAAEPAPNYAPPYTKTDKYWKAYP